MNKLILSTVFLFNVIMQLVWAQDVTIKNNLLYSVTTFTPNLGIEIKLGEKYTLDVRGSYNPWNLNRKSGNNTKLVHWVIQPEFRYWFQQSFDGHYLGIHALYSDYNISQRNLNIFFGKGSKNYRYEGNMYGGGITYGYQWVLSQKWNLETDLGLGILFMNYDTYNAQKCGKWIASEHQTYFGPTKVGISLIYKL